MKRLNTKCALLLFAACSVLTGCGSGSDDDIDTEEKTEATINYTITISPDLLKFVTPQVSYVDENGNLVTITGVEELDGKVIEAKAETTNENGTTSSVWSQVVVSGTGYKCWTVQMKFSRLNFHSYMVVKYIRNDFTEDTSGKVYDFHHGVNTGVALIKKKGYSTSSYVDNHMSITVGNYKKGDNVENYLELLATNPDKVGYYIDGNGNVNRKDEI